MAKPEDQFYINKVLAGDNSAFAVLVDRHKFNVFNISVKILGNKEIAEEVAQDTFLKAFEKLNTFKQEAKFSTWLFRIAYNMSISQQRKNKSKPLDLDDYYQETYAEDEVIDTLNLESEDDRESILKEAISKLNSDQRLLLELYYDKEMALSEIADILDLTVSIVKVKIHRSRQKLFKLMQAKALFTKTL